MDITYQPFRGGDELADQVADFHLGIRAGQLIAGEAQFSDPLDSLRDLSNTSSYYLRPGGAFYLAQRQGAVVGICGLRRTGSRTGQVKRVAVDPAVRGQGVATTMLSRLLDAARRLGVTRVTLATGARERARPVYLRLGFTDVGRDPSNGDYLMQYTA